MGDSHWGGYSSYAEEKPAPTGIDPPRDSPISFKIHKFCVLLPPVSVTLTHGVLLFWREARALSSCSAAWSRVDQRVSHVGFCLTCSKHRNYATVEGTQSISVVLTAVAGEGSGLWHSASQAAEVKV